MLPIGSASSSSTPIRRPSMTIRFGAGVRTITSGGHTFDLNAMTADQERVAKRTIKAAYDTWWERLTGLRPPIPYRPGRLKRPSNDNHPEFSRRPPQRGRSHSTHAA